MSPAEQEGAQPTKLKSSRGSLLKVEIILNVLGPAIHPSVLVAKCGRFLAPDKVSCHLLGIESPNSSEAPTDLILRYSSLLEEAQIKISGSEVIPSNKALIDSIEALVEENNIDLLIMEMSDPISRSSFNWFKKPDILKILDHIPCSVLLLKKAPAENTPLKVLFSHTGSIYSASAAAMTTKFLSPEYSTISILSVNTPDYLALSTPIESIVSLYSDTSTEFIDYHELERGLEQEMKQSLENIKEFFDLAGYTVSNVNFVQGNTIEKILEESRKYNVDLIVMGAHRGITRPNKLLGEVALEVIQQSEASVAILR